jgi:DNA-binding LacI/PurR family transcriptional regulator
VSRATVSYVLNDVESQRISQETRERVKRVALRMGYQPHAAARALRDGNSTIVVVELPYWPIGPAVAEALSAVVTKLEARDYTALLHFERTGRGESLARACARVQPVALIAPAEELSPQFVRTLRASGTAAIIAIGEKPSRLVPTFIFSQEDVGRAAVRHLADRGHINLLALMPADPETTRFRDARLLGAENEAERCNVQLTTLLTEESDDDLAGVLLPTLAGGNRATAIYAYNDELALRALELLLDHGIAVPADVAIVGCDNSPLARASRPRLSSVQLPSIESWEAVAEAVDGLLRGRRVSRVLATEAPTVIERETS